MRATAEELAEDPEAYDCESCPVRAWQARLDEDDRLALRVFGMVTAPGVQEMGLMSVVYDALGLTMTAPEALAFVARLSVLWAHTRATSGATLPLRDED